METVHFDAYFFSPTLYICVYISLVFIHFSKISLNMKCTSISGWNVYRRPRSMEPQMEETFLQYYVYVGISYTQYSGANIFSTIEVMMESHTKQCMRVLPYAMVWYVPTIHVSLAEIKVVRIYYVLYYMVGAQKWMQDKHRKPTQHVPQLN